MSSDENLYLNVEISSTETNTDCDSDDSIGELSSNSDDTSINVEVEDDEPINEEENETIVEGEKHREDDDIDLDGNHNVARSATVPKGVPIVPMWNNQRLFPPSTKAKSKAWCFGGFKKDRTGQLIMKETICGICGKAQSYRNSPTNLSQHVQSNHTFHYEGVEEDGVEKKKEKATLDSFFNKKVSSKYKSDNPKQKAVRSKLVEWVVKNNRALAEVEDVKLVEAFAIADPKLKVPSRHLVKRDIEKLYRKRKKEFAEEVSNVEYFSGNNDAGSSSNSKSFVAVNVSYATEDFTLKKKIVDVVEMPEDKNAVNYRERIKATEEKYGISDKVFMYTTDNENTMRAAFLGHERNGCFAHIESKASKKALDNQASLKNLRLKLRKIAKKANKSSKFKYALMNQQKTRGLRQKTLEQEVKTRFTSTHTMIHSFLNDPNKNTDGPIDDMKVKENIKAVNGAMVDAKFPKRDLEKLEIKPEDVSKMIKIIPILDTLEEGITLIGAEKYATASSVLPFESKFYKVLEADDDDPYYLAKFKEDFIKEMKKRCDDNLNRKVLAKASFFDKRFEKIEKFVEKKEAEDVIKEIKSELNTVKARSDDEVTVASNNTDEPPKKKRRFLAVNLSDSEEEEARGTEEEFTRYRAEPKLKSDGCPFEWWRSRRAEYPTMARLARKYLVVSGTSTPAERVISRLGLVLAKRRLSMKGSLFSKIMFLSDCV